jgi:peptide deformylase
MLLPIIKYPDPVLERPCDDVIDFNAELRQLTDDMFETMYAAQGVGLAAPQVNRPIRVTVIDVSCGQTPEMKMVFVNPEIIHMEGKQRGPEGCLSIPDFREEVTRAMTCTVRAQDLEGKTFEITGEELLSRCMQHEIDHLNGVLFIKHISILKRDMIKRKIKKLIKLGEW